MSLAFFSDLGRNLLVRTLIATAAVFLFLGFATGALPVKCLTQGLTSCGAVPSVAPPGGDTAATPLRFAPLPAATKVATAEPTAPTLTDNEVVAATFATLQPGLSSMAPIASTFRSTAAADDTTLSTRTVKTVTIHADGTPAIAGTSSAPATQIAEASLPAVAPLVAPPSDDAAAAINAVAPSVAVAKPQVAEKLALVEDPVPVKTKKPTGGKFSIVTGQGANVHVSAGSSSKVVFALEGGSKVTVLDSSHGWIHITDAQGRSGWMYKDYLS
jgi:Bacterial SH3 domain